MTRPACPYLVRERTAFRERVDAPPLLGVGDAGVLATSVDCLLFVANIDQVRGPTLEQGREALDPLPCRKLGVVVVGERPEASHHYRYGYGYGRRKNG